MAEAKIRLSLDGQAQVITGIQDVNRQLGGLGRGAQASAQASESLTSALARIGHYGVAGGALYGVAQSFAGIGQAAFEASASAQRLVTQLNFATAGQGTRELALASDVAQRLGLNMASTAQAYAGFASAARGTALEGAGARSVFEGIAKASAVMGLSADQTSGALLAVQQMMSKGVVSAEEFRGQLGERMPIALQAGAQALGVTTAEFSKMLESGQIVAQDFLPKFSRAITEMLGDSVEQAANRLDAATARMGNAWTRLMQTVGDSGMSRALAGEATAISQYMDSVSDAMKRAETAGKGMAGQLLSGLGQVIARAPFDVLAGSANLLNGTLNAVSMGALHLDTNVSLLPNSLKSAAQQSVALERDLKAAKAELAAMQKQAEEKGAGLYFRSAMGDVQRYIDKLEEARKKQAALVSDPVGAGRGVVNPQTVGQAEQATAARVAALVEIKQKLNNVDKDYLPTLTKLHAAYEAGDIKLAEYQDLVGKLAEKNYKAEKSAKDSGKAARDAAAEQERLAKAEQKHWEDLGRTITANEQAYNKWLEQNDKTLEGLVAGNEALRLQNQTIGLGKESLDALTLSRQDAAIAQAGLNLIDAQNIEGNETRIGQIQREIRLLKERRELTAAGQTATAAADAQKTAREAAEKSARDAAAEWQKASDQIQQSLSDALMNAFMAGKGFGKTFVASVKSMFNSMVLRPVISAIVNPVSGAITSALGFSGAANAAGTGASLLSGGSSLFSAGSTLAGISSFMGELGTGLIASTQTALGLTATAAQASYAASMGVAAQTGSLIGSLGPLISAAPYLVALAGVYMLAKNLDHSGTPHTGAGTSYSAAGGLQQASSGALFNSGFTGIAYSAGTEEFTTGIVKSVVQILDTTATTFGKTAGYQAAASFADDSSKDGAWGSLFIRNLQGVITDWQAGGQSFRTFSDGTAGNNEYLAAISSDVRAAIEGIDLPDWADKMLGKLGDAPSLDQLANVVSEINATQVVLQSLGASVKVFAGLSGDAVLNIISASGGLQSFSASLGAYYENFYSEQEKFDAKLQGLNTRLQDLAAGGAFADSSEQFFKAITEPTRANFRKLIEAQDLTTTSGQATYAALLSLSGVVAELTPVTEAAAEAVQTLGTAALTLADLQKQFDGAAKTILNSTQYTAYRIQQIQQTLSAAGMDLSAQQITHATREQVLAGYQQALAAGNIEAASAILNVLDALTEVSAGFQGVTETSTSAAVAVQQVVTTLADVQGLFGNAARTLLNDVQYTAYQVAQIQATLGSVGINVTASDILGATKAQVLAGLSEVMAAGNLDAARAILSVVGALSEVSSGFQTVAATASNAAAVMQQRAGLESTLLNLTGNTAEIRARELAALDASNRGLQQHIYAIQDAQQAVQAAQQAVTDANSAYAAQESAISNLQSAAQRWIGTMATASSLLDQISGSLGGAGGNREAALWATVNGAGDIDARLSAAQELYGLITQTARTEAAAQDNALSNAKALLEYGQRLRDYVQGLKTGDLSTLTPAEKVAEALAQYQTTLAAARGGDQKALGNLQGVADTYLRLAREFDPASYTASVFTSVTSALDSLGAGLISQNQPQIDLLQSQLDATNAASASANSLSADQIARLTTLQGVVQDLQAQAATQSAIANAQVSSAQANLQSLGAAQLAAQQALAVQQQAVVTAQQAATAYMATLADVAVTDPVPDILRSLPEGIAAALAPLINANPASTAAAAAATTAQRAQIIRDYAATLPQDDTGARMLYDAAVANGVSSAELDAAMGFAAGSSLAWAVSHGLPAFAQGTNYVPADMVAQIHKGEAIVPARYNPANGGNAELLEEIRKLREEVQRLREQNNAGHLLGAHATHENTKQITHATERGSSQIAHTQRLQQRAVVA
jgi:tape measure domain-containing protein